MYWDSKSKKLTENYMHNDCYALDPFFKFIDHDVTEEVVLNLDARANTTDPIFKYQPCNTYTIEILENNFEKMLSGYFNDLKEMRFAHFLKSHPGLEEQYKEFKTLCKLYGFNEQLGDER